MAGRDVILILGTARSGTSALTRVLSLCGCALPRSVLAPTDMNPKGFWEPVDATRLNLDFLSRNGMSVGDPSMSLEGESFISHREKEAFIAEVQSFLEGCPAGPMLVVKCAGTAELFGFWTDAARRAGLSVKVVVTLRRPQEVAASAAAASDQTIEGLSANWIKVNLLSERHSRHLPRVVIEYQNLLKDWRAEAARVSKALSIELNPDEPAIDEFITPELYRQRLCGPIFEGFGYSWISRVYATLSAAARDGSIDYPLMDEIYDAYRANERTFRIAWDEWRNRLQRTQKVGDKSETRTVWKLGRDY